jgi:transcription elongation GreA/GreB family factor
MEKLTPKTECDRQSSNNNVYEIRKFIDRRITPLLPFEYDKIKLELEILEQWRSELIDLPDRTGEESAELSKVNEAIDKYNSVLENHKVIDYPNADETTITLGSSAIIKFEEGDYVELVTIVGHFDQLNKSEEDTDTLYIKAASPLGQAMLGKGEDEIAEWFVGNKTFKARIHAIDQINPDNIDN